jgi:hypothetical protein
VPVDDASTWAGGVGEMCALGNVASARLIRWMSSLRARCSRTPPCQLLTTVRQDKDSALHGISKDCGRDSSHTHHNRHCRMRNVRVICYVNGHRSSCHATGSNLRVSDEVRLRTLKVSSCTRSTLQPSPQVAFQNTSLVGCVLGATGPGRRSTEGRSLRSCPSARCLVHYAGMRSAQF